MIQKYFHLPITVVHRILRDNNIDAMQLAVPWLTEKQFLSGNESNLEYSDE